MVAAEDTRRVRALAAALGVRIGGRVISHYDAVEAARLPGLLDDVARRRAPCWSSPTPGCRRCPIPATGSSPRRPRRGLPVTCLPGPSAVTTALVLSGLPADRFCFEGFAPRRAGERRRWLQTLAAEPRAMVFFESPHRLADTLAAAVEVLGPSRAAAVCRELTKTHEEVLRGPLAELAEWAATGPVRGEITVVLAGAAPTARAGRGDRWSARCTSGWPTGSG